ncbi:hypothetical protein Tsubulata_009359 [Turnera subulata]|uniref:CCHC-type domain-containing protein n=1 Tax=Turnera subulata TaxID=218843 RepID=A0A9Q0JPF5_9ROSI|nr:hypothetical protein Tsubulata_009359 [Turnera subulata]
MAAGDPGDMCIDTLVQQTQKLQCREPEVSLHEDPEINRRISKKVLVAKLLSKVVLNKKAVKVTIQKSWGAIAGLSIHDVDVNVYLCKFEDEADKRRVLNRGPWTIMGSHLVLREWPPNLLFEELDFTTSSFWVHVWGMPLNLQTKANALEIGKVFKEVLEVDFGTDNDDEWCLDSYFRMKVVMKVDKPLVTACVWPRPDGKEVHIKFFYERLPDFCYDCGRIDHSTRACDADPDLLPAKGSYGAFIRAEISTEARRSMANTKKKLNLEVWRRGSDFYARREREEREQAGGSGVIMKGSDINSGDLTSNQEASRASNLDSSVIMTNQGGNQSTGPICLFPTDCSPHVLSPKSISSEAGSSHGKAQILDHLDSVKKRAFESTKTPFVFSAQNHYPKRAKYHYLRGSGLVYEKNMGSWDILTTEFRDPEEDLPSGPELPVQEPKDLWRLFREPNQRRKIVVRRQERNKKASGVRIEELDQQLSESLSLAVSSQVHVDKEATSLSFIDASFSKPDGSLKWYVTFVYGAPERRNRRELWRELSDLRTGAQKEWLLLGDFNSVADSSEKLGQCPVIRQDMEAFVQFMDQNLLMDLGFKGQPFTWSNHRVGHKEVKERLDRAVATTQWIELFQDYQVIHDIPVGSDHCPLILHLQKVVKPYKVPFRLDLRWLDCDGSKDVVIKAWNTFFRGSRMFRILFSFSTCWIA